MLGEQPIRIRPTAYYTLVLCRCLCRCKDRQLDPKLDLRRIRRPRGNTHHILSYERYQAYLWFGPVGFSYTCKCIGCEYTSILTRAGFQRLPCSATKADYEVLSIIIRTLCCHALYHKARDGKRCQECQAIYCSAIRNAYTEARLANPIDISKALSSRGIQTISNDIESYVTRYQAKQKAREETVDAWEEKDHTAYQGFLKYEALPIPCENEPDAIVKQARAIHAVHPLLNARADSYLYYLEEQLYACYPVAKSKSEPDIASLFYEVYPLGSKICVTDISGFDRCVSRDLRRCATSTLCSVLDIPSELFNFKRCRMRYFSFTDDGSVHSGERGTSLFAVLIIMSIQIYASYLYGFEPTFINCGDDNLFFDTSGATINNTPANAFAVTTIFQKFGLDCRIEGVYDNPAYATFLSRHWSNQGGRPHVLANPARTLLKLQLIPLERNQRPRDYLAVKAAGYYAMYHASPIIGPFLYSLCRTLAVTERHFERYIRRQFGDRYWNLDFYSSDPTVEEGDRAIIADLYGITPNQQRQLESNLCRLGWPEDIRYFDLQSLYGDFNIAPITYAIKCIPYEEEPTTTKPPPHV